MFRYYYSFPVSYINYNQQMKKDKNWNNNMFFNIITRCRFDFKSFNVADAFNYFVYF